MHTPKKKGQQKNKTTAEICAFRGWLYYCCIRFWWCVVWRKKAHRATAVWCCCRSVGEFFQPRVYCCTGTTRARRKGKQAFVVDGVLLLHNVERFSLYVHHPLFLRRLLLNLA